MSTIQQTVPSLRSDRPALKVESDRWESMQCCTKKFITKIQELVLGSFKSYGIRLNTKSDKKHFCILLTQWQEKLQVLRR